MVGDVVREPVEFTCRHCGYGWSVDYDIAEYADSDGEQFSYYRVGGVPVPSPFAPASVLCPQCHQPATVGHPANVLASATAAR